VNDAIDWAVLEIPGVKDVAERAARKLSDQYGLTLEYDDALQEAMVLLAGRPDEVRELAGDNPGLLHFRLCQRLTHLVETEAKHRGAHVSRERLIERVPE
jgi:hypothetical protein